jgi:hypothetical protein
LVDGKKKQPSINIIKLAGLDPASLNNVPDGENQSIGNVKIINNIYFFKIMND